MQSESDCLHGRVVRRRREGGGVELKVMEQVEGRSCRYPRDRFGTAFSYISLHCTSRDAISAGQSIFLQT